jgi:thioredoxin reductase
VARVVDGRGGAASTATPMRPFETGLPGMFAVADVRHGSVTRVAAFAGDGAVAIRSVHEYVGET